MIFCHKVTSTKQEASLSGALGNASAWYPECRKITMLMQEWGKKDSFELWAKAGWEEYRVLGGKISIKALRERSVFSEVLLRLLTAAVNEQRSNEQKRLTARRRVSSVGSDQYVVSQIQDVYWGDVPLSRIKYSLWSQKVLTLFSVGGLVSNPWKLYADSLEEFDLIWTASVFVREPAPRKDFIPFAIKM